ncbi:MAG: aminomethyltransferase family protein [Gammaproteobacteria bacterium]|nr:aminomethyltransferase family protein [Gammaproteobacteria bacterium]
MSSSDGQTRDLVTTMPGAGWDYSLTRHPYHEIERPFGPHYCVYNRRLMACCFDALSTEDGYWRLRQQAAVLHTGEFPLEFTGPDAEKLLNRLFTKDITRLKPGRCGYGLACYEDGGLLVDGILLRLGSERFWYAQADGDFFSWARAHASGLNVTISDPGVFVSQVQGPESLNILASAAAEGLPDPFGYFALATVNFGGQDVVISRTGYTNELGWEFYTESHHDAGALWDHLCKAGAAFGMELFGLDSMHIRRIEAGILNAGSDFDQTTTPYDVGLGLFVDTDKADFIGKNALQHSPTESRLTGLLCEAEPHIGAEVKINGRLAGRVTAGAISPYLQQGIGIALMDKSGIQPGTLAEIGCVDGNLHPGKLASLPLYDEKGEIQRGKKIAIPERP